MRPRPSVYVGALAAVSMLAMIPSSFAGTSNCLTAWGGVGCDDAACQAAVCDVDNFCCVVAWDSVCAGEAVSLCGALCGGSDSDRSQPNDSRNGALCCLAWGGIGCDDVACEAAVCAVDSYCCTIEWDQICADEACTLCTSLCSGCARTCTGGDCCTANGGLGCDDFDCCNTVCMYDGECCWVAWDQSCADAAIGLCGTYCSVKPADLNGDGVVDGADLGILLGGWGFAGVSDINGDDTTDGVDLDILLGSWTG